jgi:hypothetical protein
MRRRWYRVKPCEGTREGLDVTSTSGQMALSVLTARRQHEGSATGTTDSRRRKTWLNTSLPLIQQVPNARGPEQLGTPVGARPFAPFAPLWRSGPACTPSLAPCVPVDHASGRRGWPSLPSRRARGWGSCGHSRRRWPPRSLMRGLPHEYAHRVCQQVISTELAAWCRAGIRLADRGRGSLYQLRADRRPTY